MGRPKKYTADAEIKLLLEKYVDDTEIPIVAEFAYLNNVSRKILYENYSDTIKKLICKKEAQLERLALTRKIDKTMAIFSLKQLGWRDIPEQKQSDDRKPIPYEIIEDNTNTK